MNLNFRIRYLQKAEGINMYLGQWLVGQILKKRSEPSILSTPHFVAYLSLPGIQGPVCRSESLQEVQVAASVKIRGWLEECEGSPSDHEERPRTEPVQPQRVQRTRPAAPVAPARVRRSR